jgi:nickel transport protein
MKIKPVDILFSKAFQKIILVAAGLSLRPPWHDAEAAKFYSFKPNLVIGLLLGLFIFLFPAHLGAHGVENRVEPGGIAVAFQYSSGEAMSYAKITVMPPDGAKTFQVGHTDRNGRFCFYPDAPGDWKVTADDNQGHRLPVTLPVATDQIRGVQIKDSPQTPTISKIERAFMGVSLIFVISGILFY